MKYELAKELKEAGFPQKNYKIEKDTEELCYIPSLEELIEACEKHPRGFCFLRKIDNDWYAQDGNMRGMDNGWDGKIAKGKTPTEAVAHLWLALNKK